MLDDLTALFGHLPMWIGPVAAAATFIVVRYCIPYLIPAEHAGIETGALLTPLLRFFSWLAAGAVLIAWVTAEFNKYRSRALLDAQSGLASIRSVSWQDFEHLICEAYRRQGYIATVVGGQGGDGGIDVELHRAGERVIVQCKQWKVYRIGVTTVRELLGVVTSERATRGILITSGTFTAAARRFASGSNCNIELVDGSLLSGLIRDVQAGRSKSSAARVTDSQAAPKCPLCGSGMVLRTARRGPHAGIDFWGCKNYPNCHGKLTGP